ncbi:SpaH/EbpB family LPXTG-anchored major pilin [Corynebacterium diphtheriae]|uniref:SpaH/EbpB family LPXTG-anchored major pilin n=1 Tax=Corynebacterium diphtheriae TaxID=1717 RepID=UPI0013CAA99D|nr:SpaH/EbpB family LPXTG-anchored major pilin [Corynebacterium diphtheriae]UJM22015.1 SpaH/EbpB family LPXTG-anchored major pilin [Corynebacterium diphtheriae]CAB0784745.1 isopeptide-forming domain-containing fimbrial protein [Corynebacterium diphtheriae]CAB0936280.1 isopeptide-forming domain-containing fimbrial protein [Corynebacterium diphtheriae]
MNKFSRTARSVTFAAIVGLSLGVSAPGAFAQESDTTKAIGVTERNPEAGAGNIDFSKTGKITIHKRLGVEGKDNNTGLKLDSDPGQPVADGRVLFKVEQVRADLKTNEGFNAAKKMTAGTAEVLPDGKQVEAKIQNSVAEFPNLPIGVYKVTEILEPGETKLVAAAPFLVFVPTTGPDGKAWNYDIHVYPKNSESKVEKTVKDADVHTNADYTYTITGQAPTISESKPLTKFEFSDTLDPRLQNPKVTEVKSGATTMDPEDYEVTSESPFTVKLKESGLKKVKSGETVSLTFSVQRKSVGEDIKLENEATVIFNNPNTNADVTQKTPKVETYHGKLKVLKQDNDTNEALAGAKFELYKCTSKNNLLGAALTVNGLKEWTTDTQGKFEINGLHISDFADGAESAPVSFKYCLKETQAPSGYQPLAEPVEIEFTRAAVQQVDGANADDDAVSYVAKIKNLRQDTPNLPLTGGAGVGILAAIGAAIIGAGAWFARRNSAEA